MNKSISISLNARIILLNKKPIYHSKGWMNALMTLTNWWKCEHFFPCNFFESSNIFSLSIKTTFIQLGNSIQSNWHWSILCLNQRHFSRCSQFIEENGQKTRVFTYWLFVTQFERYQRPTWAWTSNTILGIGRESGQRVGAYILDAFNIKSSCTQSK